VEIVVDGLGPVARLEVRDHGIGIGPGDQARVFERFERAVSRRRFGGLGLGLWIARQVVEAHGGTISLSSEPGRGSTFTVELPRALATG
jgi:signal transduction histidine kinase